MMWARVDEGEPCVAVVNYGWAAGYRLVLRLGRVEFYFRWRTRSAFLRPGLIAKVQRV